MASANNQSVRRVRLPFLRSPWSDIIKFLLVIAALAWLLYRGTESLGYNWQWYRVSGYILSVKDGKVIFGPLIQGLMVTLHICGWSLVFSFLFGLLTALLRMSDSLVGRGVARCYLELIRNTPLLVQLFFLYFVVAPVLDIDRFTAGVLALSLFEGAYASEIFRAGIVSIARGQWEAAHTLGLTTFQTYRYIILPQAIRYILPPLTSQAVALIKDSALVSTIAIYDLTMQGQVIISETFLTFEIWFTVAAIYLVLTAVLSTMADIMAYRLKTAS